MRLLSEDYPIHISAMIEQLQKYSEAFGDIEVRTVDEYKNEGDPLLSVKPLKHKHRDPKTGRQWSVLGPEQILCISL
jgi:hypothetical protein